MPPVIELPRKRELGIAALFVGLIFMLVVAVIPSAPAGAYVLFLGPGVLLVVFGARSAFARTPRFRATADEVWFGGGSSIPWSDVKQVFPSGLDVRNHQTRGISFVFHRRSTILRAPVGYWATTPFVVGDIDISPPATAESSMVLASRLEAMRVAAAERIEHAEDQGRASS